MLYPPKKENLSLFQSEKSLAGTMLQWSWAMTHEKDSFVTELDNQFDSSNGLKNVLPLKSNLLTVPCSVSLLQLCPESN